MFYGAWELQLKRVGYDDTKTKPQDLWGELTFHFKVFQNTAQQDICRRRFIRNIAHKYRQRTLYSTTRGHDFKLIKQTYSVDATKYYFTNRVVNVVNSLPSHIVSSPTLSTFKSRLGKHDFSSYLLQFTV